MLETNNLQLIPVERIHLEAFSKGKNELAALLQVSVPDGWPKFPEAFALPEESRGANLFSTDWPGFFFIHPNNKTLIGNGGFTGAPDELGAVEIGYEIAPEYWNRGFATEAAGALIAYAFTHEKVQAVVAHTLAEKNASNSVLQRIGMKFALELADAQQDKLWRWQISRNDYHRDLI